jgi:hypothetical protein
MTELYDDDSAQAPDWASILYEVVNPDHTVGVACNRSGEVVGLLITDEAREEGDTWLAEEIVRLARLANTKSRVGLRAEMEFNGAGKYAVDALGLPTEADYRAMEDAELGTV